MSVNNRIIKTVNIATGEWMLELLDENESLYMVKKYNNSDRLVSTTFYPKGRRQNRRHRRHYLTMHTFSELRHKNSIYNWSTSVDLPPAKLTLKQLYNLIESHPYGFLDWPWIAGQLGFRVRADRNWHTDVEKGILCTMDLGLPYSNTSGVHYLLLGGKSYLLVNQGKTWVERTSYLFGDSSLRHDLMGALFHHNAIAD